MIIQIVRCTVLCKFSLSTVSSINIHVRKHLMIVELIGSRLTNSFVHELLDKCICSRCRTLPDRTVNVITNSDIVIRITLQTFDHQSLNEVEEQQKNTFKLFLNFAFNLLSSFFFFLICFEHVISNSGDKQDSDSFHESQSFALYFRPKIK